MAISVYLKEDSGDTADKKTKSKAQFNNVRKVRNNTRPMILDIGCFTINAL